MRASESSNSTRIVDVLLYSGGARQHPGFQGGVTARLQKDGFKALFSSSAGRPGEKVFILV